MTTVAHRTPTVLENARFVDTPTGTPPPLPAPKLSKDEIVAPLTTARAEMERRVANRRTAAHLVDTVGALTVLSGSITGLAVTAMQHPGTDLVFYPITTTLAAAVVGAIVLYRSPSCAVWPA